MGDRTLGAEPMRVAALGRAVIEGLADGGVVGIVKHMPGHGRAMVDSHHELPIVTADEDALAIDLAPFQALKDAPMGMRSEEHTSELQSLMRISYAVFCLKTTTQDTTTIIQC